MFNRPLTPFGAAFTPPIEQSLIFDGAAYLSWTPGGAGNRKTWTWSGWVRRSRFGLLQTIFCVGDVDTGGTFCGLYFNATDDLRFFQGGGTPYFITNQLFRDIGWYHFAVVADTTQATASDRLKIYINGVLITSYSLGTYPTLNQDMLYNNNVLHYIGRDVGVPNYFNGAMADIHFIDGTALSQAQIQSTFLQDWPFDGQSIPAPQAVSGLTYGTNGFHLAFADTSAFGDDTSGNGNDWTPTGFVAGDQTADVPGRPWNLLSGINKGTAGSLTDGGLALTEPGSSHTNVLSVFPITDQKIYFEVTYTSTTSGSIGAAFGLALASVNKNTSTGGTAGYYNIYTSSSGGIYNSTSLVRAFSTLASGTYRCAYDGATGELYFGDATGWWDAASGYTADPSTGTNAPITLTPGAEYFPYVGTLGNTLTVNFGQRAFAYTPPSGFLPLSTDNLPTPLYAGGNWFNANPYVGTGATNSITGVGFQRDLGWIKARAGVSTNHNLINVISGDTLHLSSNTTDAEQSNSGNYVSTDADGFTVEGGDGEWNLSTRAYISWSWKAGGAGVANTDGTISSTVSVAAPGHFAIVSNTGTGSAGTIGHGMGGVPELIIGKNRDAAVNWVVYHKFYGSARYGALNITGAFDTANANLRWNSTDATATVFSVGTSSEVNGSANDMVWFLWRSIPGLCKVGSYTGNGSADGPLIDLGFKARWIMVKRVDAANSWVIQDTARGTINPVPMYLQAESSSAETATTGDIDINAAQVKIRNTGNAWNASGGTYIYLALAELAGGGDAPWPLAA